MNNLGKGRVISIVLDRFSSFRPAQAPAGGDVTDNVYRLTLGNGRMLNEDDQKFPAEFLDTDDKPEFSIYKISIPMDSHCIRDYHNLYIWNRRIEKPSIV